MPNELKQELNILQKRIQDLRSYLDLPNKEVQIASLEKDILQSGFWQNQERANSVIKTLKGLKSIRDPFLKIENQYKELSELLEITDEGDESSLNHMQGEIGRFAKEVDTFEFRTLLSQEEDSLNAILSINAGAGGTESCDWANMLLRMYTRWAERKDFSVEKIDALSGEEAGIKNATIMIRGPYAYGYLKGEMGVHRLVRISPFDSNKRRHTSFASIDVIPEISENIKVNLNPSDLRIDTYRSGGAGGQHVNVTDSAVRITHLPTGIVVQCQNERSQYKNKSTALKILRARIYEREMDEKRKKAVESYEDKKRIEWGSQIRSYVLHPYSMVKDHRTGFQTSDALGVLDGDLDGAIEAYLKSGKSAK
ncbi:MAG: peptide chain release factor 2 [Candidatus Omnitrophota bacterium]